MGCWVGGEGVGGDPINRGRSDKVQPMSEEHTPAADTPKAAAPPPKPPPKPKPPPRELPTMEGIADFMAGEDYPLVNALFNQLVLPKYDGLYAQIKKEEILPQHWQVIVEREPDADLVFADQPIVRRLRESYSDPEVAERRLAALEVAWEELRGKSPALWTAQDVFHAMRRILQKKRDIDHHELLSAVRDVWRGMTLPHGREQIEQLWACLAFVRKKTRK